MSMGHRGFLTHEWQGEELSDLSVFDQIVNHSDPQQSEQIQVASASQGREWLWERDETGDLASISPGYANSELSRWAHTNTATQTARRAARHKLDEVTTPALGEVSIAHDARGRVAEDAGFAYRHGADDRLVRARALPQTSTSSEEVYFYDGHGKLVQILRAHTPHLPAEERFVHDGEQKVASYRGAQLGWEAWFGAGLDHLLLFDHVEQGEEYLPLSDERLNTVALWSTSRYRLEAMARYSAQGHRSALEGPSKVACNEEEYGALCEQLGGAFPFGLHSAWRSPLTGLSQMRQRWYSPTLGQYLSHDPLEQVDSFNLYAFVSHDPINRWDPFGLDDGGLVGFGRDVVEGFFGFFSDIGETLVDDVGKCMSPGVDCLPDAKVAGHMAGEALEGIEQGAEKRARQAVECMGNMSCMAVKELQEHEALNQVVDGALEGDGEKVGRGGAALFMEGTLTVAGGAGGKGVGMAKPRVRPKSPRVKPKAPKKVGKPKKVESFDDASTSKVGNKKPAPLKDEPCTTCIGRMDDLKKFDSDPKVDTWRKTGRVPSRDGGPPVTWRENREWLQERLDRGDSFGIATDPATLPNPNASGYIPDSPNGYFTARELKYLNEQGIKPKKMYD